MEQREIEFIAEQEWKRYQEWRKDPKNAKVVNFADRLYHDLNQLGYNIQWGFSMQPSVFNGDNRIFPICKKYIEEAELDDELIGCVDMTIGILGHKKMRIATGYLIKNTKQPLSARQIRCFLILMRGQSMRYGMRDIYRIILN